MYMLERAKVLITMLDEGIHDHTDVFSSGGRNYGYWVNHLPGYFQWVAQDW